MCLQNGRKWNCIEFFLFLEIESVPASLLIFEFWSVAGAVVFDGSDGCCCVDAIVDDDTGGCSGCGSGRGAGCDDDSSWSTSLSSSSLSAISSIWSIDFSDLIDLIDNDRVTLDGISSICTVGGWVCTGGTISLLIFASEFVSIISGGVGLLAAEMVALLPMLQMLLLLLLYFNVVLLMTDTIEPPVDSSTTVSATGNR